ncbi:MAG: FHA domain-containing protein [Candidatus Flexifilum sp.]|jgi:hypothetical protein
MIQGGESFRLVVRRGPQPNQIYELSKDVVTLGRDITNDITINDPEVSRHHMRLMRGAGGYTVEDLGSTNGTFVNGQRVSAPRPLRPGDMVGLGETVTLAYEMAMMPDMPGMAPPQYGATVPSAVPPSAPSVGMPSGYPPQPTPVTPPQQPAYQPPAPGFQPQGGQPAVPGVPGQGAGYGQSAGYPAAGGQYAPAMPGQYGQAGYGQAGGTPMPPQAPPTGYAGDYDPYAVRDEEQNNTLRWVLIGCGAATLLCCCTSVIGLVAVDSLCLWESLGPIYSILRTLGFRATC